MTIDGFADGYYTVTWVDDYTGAVVAISAGNAAERGRLVTAVPPYERSIAGKIARQRDAGGG